MDVQNARDGLERAGEQLHDVCDQLDAYIDLAKAPPPYNFVPAEGDPHHPVQYFRMKLHRKPPRRIGILVGEFMHNLNSTLDVLMWEYFVANHLPTDNRLYFPVYTHERDFKTEWGKRLALLEPDARELIESVQPYKRWEEPFGDAEGHPLAMIRRFARTKHRKPVLTINAVPVMRVWVSTGEPPLIQLAAGGLNDGEVVARVDFTANDADIDIQAAITGYVVVDEWGPLSWTPLPQVMIKAHEFTNYRIVDPFSKL